MPATPSDNSRAMTMTIEEKAKRYDEALERAKKQRVDYQKELDKTDRNSQLAGLLRAGISAIDMAFPELTESEDERIRKWLYDLVDEGAYLCERPFATESILAYLEKQKEQKPHTDEEKEYVRTIKSIISDFIRDKKPENLAYYQRIYDWLDGRHVPFSCGHENGKSAWSEEDENALKYIHELLVFGYTEKFMDAQTAHDMRKWVNEHLRPDTFQNGNSHWKPSEEQIDALEAATVRYQSTGLKSLYEDLKKL